MKGKKASNKTLIDWEHFSFEKPSHKIICRCDISLTEAEIEIILKSQSAAARELALSESGYNRSQGQSEADKTEFDQGEFAYRAWKYLPSIGDKIMKAVEANDIDYFIALGRNLETLKKRPSLGSVDPLGNFLVQNWCRNLVNERPTIDMLRADELTDAGKPAFSGMLSKGSIRVPPFCVLSNKVLVEVCNLCLQPKKGSPTMEKPWINEHTMEMKVNRLGLKRAKKHILPYCGLLKNGRLLCISDHPQKLRMLDPKMYVVC